MDLLAVMAEINTRLGTIAGLRTVELGAMGAGTVNPPAAVLYVPDRINFDLTYGRGLDEYEDLSAVVFVGMPNARAALAELSPYVAGSGAKSIKAKLDETTGGAYASCSTVTVQNAEVDVAKMGGVDLLAAVFHCKITGPGA